MMGQADYVVAVYDNDPKHYSGVGDSDRDR